MSIALKIASSGMCCSVGTSARAARAAIRAGLSRYSQSQFVDQRGVPITVASAPVGELAGARRLTSMLAAALADCLAGRSKGSPHALDKTGLWLLLSDEKRPGYNRNWQPECLQSCRQALGGTAQSERTISAGRTSIVVALAEARRAIAEGQIEHACIAGVDSYLNSRTINHLLRRERIKASDAADGFIPGEAAAALMLTSAQADVVGADPVGADLVEEGAPALEILAEASADDAAHIDNEAPVRADGMVAAIRAALSQSGVQLSDLDFRVADIAGESFFFREAGLALSRVFDRPREHFPLFHLADSVGETGAAVGPLSLAYLAGTMVRRGAETKRALFHLADDGGQRAAIIVQAIDRTARAPSMMTVRS